MELGRQKRMFLRKSDSAAETNGLVKEKKNRRKANKAKKNSSFLPFFLSIAFDKHYANLLLLLLFLFNKKVFTLNHN